MLCLLLDRVCAMTNPLHLEKTKYRQWVKAGLGLTYLREGLVSFCEDITKQQHNDILDNIKQDKNLLTVACGQCSWTTLRPDHAKGGNRSCKLGQRNCNCCNPTGKITCPNKVCGAIYDAIVSSHGFTPPAPYWKNTETQHWCTDPWSIAKCYINAPGYDRKTSSADIDCIGFLHLIRNNQYFHDHIQCTIAQIDVFSKVITDRNEIFHSSTMQLEETDADSYIDDMIAVLQDGKELKTRQDAQGAVQNLLKLKKEDFIISTKTEADVVHAAVQSISFTMEEFENKLREKLENVPTTESVTDLETRVTMLELDMATVKEEIKELKMARSFQRDQYDFIKSKLEFQEQLMKLYKHSLLQVSAIPLQPGRKHCNFREVYVRPRITHETKDENRRPKENEIKSLSDIFIKEENRLKSIYVLGDAGSGKSSFCKSLVNYWCLAHSEEQTIEDEFHGIKEMKKFDFLFYISLRRYQNIVSIQKMIQKQYKSEILNELLDKESEKIIIVLDGLDEWTSKSITSNQFQTEGLPERDTSKKYTIITTSRPWKIETLGITDKEIEQRLKLKGFDKSSVKTMIAKTVPVLNESFAENKSCRACEDKLENKSIASMKEVPIMLLQLICLWFDGTLQVSSRCAIYSGMLELFFSWTEKKKPEDRLFRKMRRMSKDLLNIELPHYLINKKLCNSYKYLIYGISRLAYETLFTNIKETSLTFESSIFEDLEISDEVKTCCLKLGILSEDRCPNLSASTSDSSLLSFVHKSVQEYMAAVYITIKFKAYIRSSADSEKQNLSDYCAQLIKEVFSMCTTLDEILEQANVFIMLCGLEPRIATSISKYIYDIVAADKRVLEYRRSVTVHEYRHQYIMSDIQECILHCIEEVRACQTHIQFEFYLGDIIVQSMSVCDNLCIGIDKQYIFPGSVLSFRVDKYKAKEYLKRISNYLPKCQRLEAIYFLSNSSYRIDNKDIKSFCGAVEGNTSTLKALTLDCGYNDNLKPVCEKVVRHLLDMNHLVALKIERVAVTHEDFTSLCTFLSGTSNLEEITILDTKCERSDRHEVDLSKHQQLQCLEYSNFIIVTRVNTLNLEIFEFRSLNSTNCEKVYDILSSAYKLTRLVLFCNKYNDSTHIIEKLITLLPSLYRLHEFILEDFPLTDNIMKCPAEMKSMKNILLIDVRMGLTTWRQFVDSLFLMPLTVKVRAWRMCITRDGIDFGTPEGGGGGGETAAAWQYVREQEALSKVAVEYADTCRISFSTEK
ncbi:uncharacterized protein LOC123534312 [Mercenaria mercenaria]|uniref:uncharacterized protein LOC123534312 n=1 Tax=Mercenaria mercenaria TaxID=6596 RepID=UPI00234EFD15|nr:uncharacterized protein LOC123534312 [Mercenaria mercenaria]